jgi:hypothetical protein
MSDDRLPRPLLVFNLAGSQADMGHQHGTLLREVGGHERVLAYYPRMPEIFIGGERGGVPGSVLRPLLALALRSLNRDRPVPYRERSRAFFSALGYPPRFSQHLFAMDLLQNVVGLAGRFGIGPSRRLMASAAVPGCSSIAVWGRTSSDGSLRHARNFDFPGSGLWEREPAVVFCTPDHGLRYGFVTTRGADVPGVTAFNEAGITLGAHTRFHRDIRFSGAGIVDLGHEIVRRSECLADAVRVARERKIASSWGIIVSSAREGSAVVLETTGRAVDVVRPAPGEDFLLQTNRYLCSSLVGAEVAPSTGHLANSDGRARALRSRAIAGGLGTEELEALLGSSGDPEDPGRERPAGGVLAQGITVSSVVSDPAARAVHVSVGPCPTGKGPWVLVPWAWDAPRGRWLVTATGAGSVGFGAGAGRAAHEKYLAALAADGQGAPLARVARIVDEAVALDPGEPVYRLLAGGLALRAGDARGALAHFEAGLERERTPFARGLLLLWGSRAAEVEGDRSAAHARRRELLALEHPLVLDSREAARREERSPLPLRVIRRVGVNLVFPDLTL